MWSTICTALLYLYKNTNKHLNWGNLKEITFEIIHTFLESSLKNSLVRLEILSLWSTIHIAISLICPFTLIISFRMRWVRTCSVFLRTSDDSSRNLETKCHIITTLFTILRWCEQISETDFECHQLRFVYILILL